MRDSTRRELARRSLIAGALAAGFVPDMLTSRQAYAQAGKPVIAPKKGGTLNTILTPEPPVLVPGVNNQGPTALAAGKLFQGLCQYSFTLQPIPQLAKSRPLSDGK